MKTRLVAAGLHFLGSALVISLSLSVIYFIWYPEPFYTIHSVFDAVKIVLVVDLVLGPFLTMVVFDLSKQRSELMRDISIIIIFQIIALGWGLHITYKMRPLFLVFQGETFYSMVKGDLKMADLNETVSSPHILQRPISVYVEPLTSEEAVKQMEVITSGGKINGEMYKVEKYKPLSMQTENEYMQDVLKHATTHTLLLESKTWKNKVEQFLKSQGGNGDDYLFYSIENPAKFSGIIIFNKKDFSFAGLME